jgi:hypothetical protein
VVGAVLAAVLLRRVGGGEAGTSPDAEPAAVVVRPEEAPAR